MLTSTPVTPIALDGDGYAHGADCRIHMDNDGWYTVKAMTTPHGNGRHLTISANGGASSCVSSLTVFAGGTCYIHWMKEDSNVETVMWRYEGIDGDAILWQFLMTLSLGSVANLIKRTATESENCDASKELAVAV